MDSAFCLRSFITSFLLACSVGNAAAIDPYTKNSAQQEILRSAQLWQSKYRTDLARQHIEKLLLVDPNSPWGLATLASIALQENKPQEAKQIIDRLYAQNAGTEVMVQLQHLLRLYEPQAQQALAQMRLFAQSGRAKEAAALAHKLFPQGPLVLGGFALEYYRIIAAIPGVDPELDKKLLIEYERTGDVQYQYIWIQRSLERASPSRNLLNQLEKLALKASDDDKTIQILWRWALQRTPWELIPDAAKKFLSRYPKDEAIKQMLAESHDRQRALQQEASLPINVAKRAAEQALNQNQFDLAVQEARKVLNLNPKDADGWGFIGYASQRQGLYLQAQEAFEKAFAFDKELHWQRLATSANINALLQSAQQALLAQNADAMRTSALQILEIDKYNADAMTLMAQALQLKGQYAQAQVAYQQVLLQHPLHIQALHELVRMLITQKQWEEASQSIDAHLKSLPEHDSSMVHGIRAEILQGQSESLWEQGKRSLALRLQEQALILQPSNPWIRYRLARMYLTMDDAEGAKAVIQEGVSLNDTDPEMRYASALIAASNNEWGKVEQDLLSIPFTSRSIDAQQLLYASQLHIQIAAAQNAKDKQTREVAIARASEISSQSQHVETQIQLAGIWANAGYYLQASRIWERLAQSQTLSPSMQLMYAQALDGHMSQSPTIPVLLNQLMNQKEALSEKEQQQLLDLYTARAERLIEQHLGQGQLHQARVLARETLLPQLLGVQTQVARGNLLAAAQDWEGALNEFGPALKNPSPDFMLMLNAANAYWHIGDAQTASDLAHKAHAIASEQQFWQQLALVRLWQRLDAPEKAEKLLNDLEPDSQSDRNEVLLHRARIAMSQERYLQALDDFHTVANSEQLQKEAPDKQASVIQDYQVIQGRKQSWLEVGFKRFSKSGDAGISALKGWEFLNKAWTADKKLKGHHFLQVDRLRLDAGTLPTPQNGSVAGVNEYGQIAAYLSQGNRTPQLKDSYAGPASGFNVGIGFEGERYAWDVGLIGLNTPITNLVGGMSFELLQTPRSTWRVSLARRPMTGSMLSYLGARDPATSTIWGGVINNVASLQIANRQGFWDRSANLSFGLLTGKNVATNAHMQLRLSTGTDVWATMGQHVYMGTTLQFQAHRKNLAEYSWGHGGYYSPKFGTTLSFPVEWSGRSRAWAWRIQSSVSVASTAKSFSNLYPRATTLKDTLTSAEQKNYYSTSGGSGTGWALQVALERQINSNLALGAQFSIDRSEDYAPNKLQLYMRFLLNPVRQLSVNHPRVLIPYSEY